MAVPLVNDNINMGRESTELNTDLEMTVNSRDTHDVSVNEESELRQEASFLDNFLDNTQSSATVQENETETETEHVHVPRDTPHTVDNPADTDNVIVETAPNAVLDSSIARMMAQMAAQHSQTMSAHTALNSRVESLALSVAHTNDELASTNARVELLSVPSTTTFTNRTLPRVREDESEIEDVERENDGDESVYSAIDDRRASIFPGIGSSELSKTNLPKRFTDGSAVKATYSHRNGEDIIQFFHKIERELRIISPVVWVHMLYEQVGETVRKTLEAERESLKEGRFKIRTDKGEIKTAPAEDWADFNEVKRFMLEKYKRKLGENKEIQSLIFKDRQFTSFEAYINAIEIKLTNIKDVIP
jgi:hypothetical protein